MEILIVDDGSKDETAAIADRYEQEYPSIVKAIHKENGGVSSARNMGLDHAQGKYIVFVDSDDYLGENYLQALYAVQQASDGNAFVIADYQPFSPDGLVSRDFSSAFIVSLSGGKNDAETVKNVMSLKPDGYLLKSMNPQKLHAAIDDFFASRGK